MQKQVFIALAIVGTLTAGFFLFRNKPTKEVDVNPTALRDIFNQWKVNYNVKVGAGEEDFRFKVFASNYAKITKQNSLLGRKFTLGLNAFTHLTQEEFSATHLGLKVAKKASRNVSALPKSLKTSVDHRGKMNAVKDQGQCGSCWAFSAVGALEGFHSVVNGKLFNLAEQQLVDCSGSYGNMGCNGGLMDQAFQYVIAQGGLGTQDEYPYKAVDGSCIDSKVSKTGPISGYTDVEANSAEALKAAIAKQPVSVAIEADTFTFQGYSSGVITGDACGTNLDHGVVAVGFNDEASTPYYIVRNSWGAGWGDKGHVLIGIEDGAGVCGIQQMSSYPTA